MISLELAFLAALINESQEDAARVGLCLHHLKSAMNRQLSNNAVAHEISRGRSEISADDMQAPCFRKKAEQMGKFGKENRPPARADLAQRVAQLIVQRPG
jgi:hypothetical protein